MKTLLKKIENNAFDLASKDRVASPTAWNLLASVGCSVLVLAWAYWVGHLGLGVWEGHSFFYKGHEYTADQAPLRAWLMWLGSVALSAFSVWAALQYALEAWWRVRRWHGVPVWPLGSTCPLSSRPVPDAVWQQASAQSRLQTAPSLRRGRRHFLRIFGILLVLLGCYLGFLMVSAHAMSPGIVAIALALCVGGGLMVVKPEVFQE